MVIKKNKIFYLFIFLICKSASSVELEPNHNEYINPLHKPNILQDSNFKRQNNTSQSVSIDVNENDLLNNVNLLERALNQSIIDENIEGITILLPIYIKVENKNKLLYLRALALKELFNNKISKSIEIYKEILTISPSSLIDQFRLAKNYFFNYQNSEAISMLIKIKENNELNTQESNFINLFIKKIKERNTLEVDTSLNLVRDNNVNQVTEKNKIRVNNGFLTPPKREKATGGNFRLFLNKNLYLRGGYFLNSSFYVNTKNYWDNQKYNDTVSRFYVGGGYKNSFLTLRLNPFYEKRWFSNKPYMDKLGINFNLNYSLNPRVQLSSSLEIAKKSYINNRAFLNGNAYSFSNYVTYLYSPKIYLNLGLLNGFETAKDKSEQYISTILNSGIGVNWTESFSNYTGISYGIKNYKAPFAFFDKREDSFIKYNLTFKYTKLAFKNFVPVFNVVYENHKSNNLIYDYGNYIFFISIDKKF